MRKWRDANREEIQARDREVKRRLRESDREGVNAAMRRWRAVNAEKVRANDRERNQRRQRKYHGWLAAVKQESGCVDCGFDADPSRLHFDHRPGELKLFEMWAAVGRPRRLVEAEIAKCDVRCASCHRKRHAAEQAAA